MAAPDALTDEDVAGVRAATAAGTPVPVWFTAAAVGVPVGGSAKVVAVGAATADDFIQVRPSGSRDTMYCSPAELTRTRPTRRRSPRAVAQSADEPPPQPRNAAPKAAPKIALPKTAAKVAAKTAPQSAAPVDEPAVPAPAGGPRRRGARTGAMTVSLRATADGEWTVEVLVGKERVVPGTPVPAGDVAAAGRSLPPAVAEAIESSLEGARQRQRDRVEQLRAELEVAQRVLDQFGA